MTLFTKPNCNKCHYITNKFDLNKLGIKQYELGPNNAEALACLAWYELVDVADYKLPILVLDNRKYITGTIKITSFLNQYIKNNLHE